MTLKETIYNLSCELDSVSAELFKLEDEVGEIADKQYTELDDKAEWLQSAIGYLEDYRKVIQIAREKL